MKAAVAITKKNYFDYNNISPGIKPGRIIERRYNMQILTLEFKTEYRYKKMLALIGDRVLYTLETHYNGKILGYIIAYIPRKGK